VQERLSESLQRKYPKAFYETGEMQITCIHSLSGTRIVTGVRSHCLCDRSAPIPAHSRTRHASHRPTPGGCICPVPPRDVEEYRLDLWPTDEPWQQLAVLTQFHELGQSKNLARIVPLPGIAEVCEESLQQFPTTPHRIHNCYALDPLHHLFVSLSHFAKRRNVF